jgi:hypothetical protein
MATGFFMLRALWPATLVCGRETITTLSLTNFMSVWVMKLKRRIPLPETCAGVEMGFDHASLRRDPPYWSRRVGLKTWREEEVQTWRREVDGLRVKERGGDQVGRWWVEERRPLL